MKAFKAAIFCSCFFGVYAQSQVYCPETSRTVPTQNPSRLVPVDIWAEQYETFQPIGAARVIDMKSGQEWITGADGYVHTELEPGRELTLQFQKNNYPSVQTATVSVPNEGLAGIDREITLQVPGNKLYRSLKLLIGKPDNGKHHVIVTISAKGRNLHDDEGEPGVQVKLIHGGSGDARKDGIYLGSIFGFTEWFRPIVTSRFPILGPLIGPNKTSPDGAVLFENVDIGRYIIHASKQDPNSRPMEFCRAIIDVLEESPEIINVGPPQGPRPLETIL